MTSGDADDSGESSPSTSMATMSVASLPAGEDMARSRAACSEVVRFGATSSNGADVVRSGATSSDGAEVVRSGATSSDGALGVRCEATCSGGAMVVLARAKTSWADGLRVEAA